MIRDAQIGELGAARVAPKRTAVGQELSVDDDANVPHSDGIASDCGDRFPDRSTAVCARADGDVASRARRSRDVDRQTDQDDRPSRDR